MTPHRTRVPAFVAAFGLAVALLGAACNSNSSPAASAGAGVGSGNSVAVVDNDFNPATLTVKAGTTVQWTNTGSATHTVTADDASFDSNFMNSGATFSHTFAAAGTFAYHCNVHSSMHGTITVTP